MRGAMMGFLGLALAGCANVPEPPPAEPAGWRLAVHGGAGVIERSAMSAADEAAYRAGLTEALAAGADILRRGGAALDAVQAAVVVLEDNPLFNAGVGAVLTEKGDHELDASIMSGADRRAGAVTGVQTIKNPILAARVVMDHTPHVMFAREGAEALADAHGLERIENSGFTTPARVESLRALEARRARIAADRRGTVGAVAIDLDGNLAAATSTGGMTGKAAGRIGDSPIIGAATYAWNGVCAVSATGHGETFIRVVVAKTICDRAALLDLPMERAALDVLGEVATLGGDGGVIVIDGAGQAHFVFNSSGMYRGEVDAEGASTAIFGPDIDQATPQP